MKFLTSIASAWLLLTPGSAAAMSAAVAGSSVEIVRPSGISILHDVLTQTNVSILVRGRAGDAVSLAVPASVDISSASGQYLSLTTSAPFMGSAILSQDAMSVNIGASFNNRTDTVPRGFFGGIMIVLAQYN